MSKHLLLGLCTTVVYTAALRNLCLLCKHAGSGKCNVGVGAMSIRPKVVAPVLFSSYMLNRLREHSRFDAKLFCAAGSETIPTE